MKPKHLLSLCTAMLFIVTVPLYLTNCVPTPIQSHSGIGLGGEGEIVYNSIEVPNISSKYSLK